jgi:carboxypeptidase C (cathepsin A)
MEESDAKKPSPEAPGQERYKVPEGSSAEFKLSGESGELSYRAAAEWIVLRKDDKPKAEMFCTAYTVEDGADRPVTFVFNGGPGASSVYLHLGALGPKRIDLDEGGLPHPSRHQLKNNEATWLEFTDLVFVDPVGTGLSRMIEDKKPKDPKKAEAGSADDKPAPSEYWRMKRDLEAIGEFTRTWLSRHHRWESPVFIAGESYGGYRVGRLAKILQKDYGVGLAGAVIISPALDFGLLDGTDYNVLPWVDAVPSMAAAALSHGRARAASEGEDPLAYALRAREFAYGPLLTVLANGSLLDARKRVQVLRKLADFIGLPRETVERKGGRIDATFFVKNLLRDEGRHLGLYDASIAVTDPFPDRDELDAPDPTLHILERAFASAINTQLRKHIGLKTDREYELLSMNVNSAWKNDEQQHVLQSQFNAVDDLRYGMSLNPHMGVFLTHGYYDLVTAFSSSDRIVALMKLTDEQQDNLTVRHYPGGHMFYTVAGSRMGLCRDMKAFYQRYTGRA